MARERERDTGHRNLLKKFLPLMSVSLEGEREMKRDREDEEMPNRDIEKLTIHFPY